MALVSYFRLILGNTNSGRSLVLEDTSSKYAMDSDIGIAFVYFNYKKQDSQSVRTILGAIIKQLARQKACLPEELREFYRACFRNAERPSAEKLAKQLSQLISTFVRVYIVVDALDEFEDRKTFLQTVIGMGSDSGNGSLKIFVTSRRERDIAAHFAKCRTPTLEIEATKVDTDIEAFVRAQVGEWGQEATEISLDDELQSEIIRVLTSKAGGM